MQSAACARVCGPACLVLYGPRRCGRLDPAAAVRNYHWAARQRALFGRYSSIVVASRHMQAEYVAHGVDPSRVSPSELAKLVSARAEIPRKAFDDAIAHAGDDGFKADPYLEQKALADTSELEPIVDEVLAQNGSQVEAYRGGKAGLLGFFVGQVMKRTNGQADPRVVSALVRQKLDA